MATDTERSIRIFTLGRFEVRQNDQVVHKDDWSRRKAATLLQRLAIERRLHKEQIIESLWPDADPDAGANNLYRTLYALRQTLDTDLGEGAAEATLSFEQGVLSLAESVWVDVDEFTDLCSQGLAEPQSNNATMEALAALERAVDLYKGDLLSDERYAEWTFTWREQFRRHYRRASLALIDHLRDEGNYARAIELLTSLLADEPADESIHCELMRLYALSGQRHHALRQYQSCVNALATELEVQPQPETEALYARILEGELTSSQTMVATPRKPPASISPVSLSPRVQPDVPLIGRELATHRFQK